MTDLRALVVVESADPDLVAVGATVQRALGAPPDDEAADDAPASPIAMPIGVAEPPARLRDAGVAVVLDPDADELAREAGVCRRVALFPRFEVEWSGPLDVDLVLVAHEGLIEDAVACGASRRRVRVCGPVAPDDWAPLADRAAARRALGSDALAEMDAPAVVVRAAALDADDLSPNLVQLSLARTGVVWLFDVGADVELARALRRHAPGYGLDALMFADGPEALRAYQAADLVLGRLHGPELVRALAVGASVVTVAPRRDQLRLAHIVESEGLVDVADAAATLAVTLDAALKPGALEEGRRAALGTDAPGGAARVAQLVRELTSGSLADAPPTGLPVGLERLDAAEERAKAAPPSGAEELDRRVEEELAALREKLGL